MLVGHMHMIRHEAQQSVRPLEHLHVSIVDFVRLLCSFVVNAASIELLRRACSSLFLAGRQFCSAVKGRLRIEPAALRRRRRAAGISTELSTAPVPCFPDFSKHLQGYFY